MTRKRIFIGGTLLGLAGILGVSLLLIPNPFKSVDQEIAKVIEKKILETPDAAVLDAWIARGAATMTTEAHAVWLLTRFFCNGVRTCSEPGKGGMASLERLRQQDAAPERIWSAAAALWAQGNAAAVPYLVESYVSLAPRPGRETRFKPQALGPLLAAHLTGLQPLQARMLEAAAGFAPPRASPQGLVDDLFLHALHSPEPAMRDAFFEAALVVDCSHGNVLQAYAAVGSRLSSMALSCFEQTRALQAVRLSERAWRNLETTRGKVTRFNAAESSKFLQYLPAGQGLRVLEAIPLPEALALSEASLGKSVAASVFLLRARRISADRFGATANDALIDSFQVGIGATRWTYAPDFIHALDVVSALPAEESQKALASAPVLNVFWAARSKNIGALTAMSHVTSPVRTLALVQRLFLQDKSAAGEWKQHPPALSEPDGLLVESLFRLDLAPKAQAGAALVSNKQRMEWMGCAAGPATCAIGLSESVAAKNLGPLSPAEVEGIVKLSPALVRHMRNLGQDWICEPGIQTVVQRKFVAEYPDLGVCPAKWNIARMVAMRMVAGLLRSSRAPLLERLPLGIGATIAAERCWHKLARLDQCRSLLFGARKRALPISFQNAVALRIFEKSPRDETALAVLMRKSTDDQENVLLMAVYRHSFLGESVSPELVTFGLQRCKEWNTPVCHWVLSLWLQNGAPESGRAELSWLTQLTGTGETGDRIAFGSFFGAKINVEGTPALAHVHDTAAIALFAAHNTGAAELQAMLRQRPYVDADDDNPVLQAAYLDVGYLPHRLASAGVLRRRMADGVFVPLLLKSAR